MFVHNTCELLNPFCLELHLLISVHVSDMDLMAPSLSKSIWISIGANAQRKRSLCRLTGNLRAPCPVHCQCKTRELRFRSAHALIALFLNRCQASYCYHNSSFAGKISCRLFFPPYSFFFLTHFPYNLRQFILRIFPYNSLTQTIFSFKCYSELLTLT